MARLRPALARSSRFAREGFGPSRLSAEEIGADAMRMWLLDDPRQTVGLTVNSSKRVTSFVQLTSPAGSYLHQPTNRAAHDGDSVE